MRWWRTLTFKQGVAGTLTFTNNNINCSYRAFKLSPFYLVQSTKCVCNPSVKLSRRGTTGTSRTINIKNNGS